MPIWKVRNGEPKLVAQSTPRKEKLLESHLEDWLVRDISILGEPLLLIGRQVSFPDTKDRLDLLALDANGNSVVIEIKRGKLRDPVDLQGIRYASYVSKWEFGDFERQSKSYLAPSEKEFNLNERYEQFCTEYGSDEAPEINSDQRIILVGSEVRDRLGSVALWLRDHSVDIRAIEIEVYRDGDDIIIEPHTIVPLAVSRFAQVGARKSSKGPQPWLSDGRAWHLEKRCNPATRIRLLRLDEILRDNLQVEGPRWNQRYYIAYQKGGSNWPTIRTGSALIKLIMRVQPGSFEVNALAKRLEVEVFSSDETLADKLGLPSSVTIRSRNDGKDNVILRIKDDFDLESEEFVKVLKEIDTMSA